MARGCRPESKLKKRRLIGSNLYQSAVASKSGASSTPKLARSNLLPVQGLKVTLTAQDKQQLDEWTSVYGHLYIPVYYIHADDHYGKYALGFSP